jgi:hypothetical protein
MRDTDGMMNKEKKINRAMFATVFKKQNPLVGIRKGNQSGDWFYPDNLLGDRYLPAIETCHCPYCGAFSYQTTHKVTSGGLRIEGRCVRCFTIGLSFQTRSNTRVITST